MSFWVLYQEGSWPHLNGEKEKNFMKGPYKVVGRKLRRTNKGWKNTPELETERSHSQP